MLRFSCGTRFQFLDSPFDAADIWIYTKKVDTKQDFILHFSKHKGGMVSMTHRPYDEDFKKSIVALYQNGKTQSQLSKEYGVSLSAIGKWIRLYSEVKTVDGDIMTAKQIKDLQRRNAQLEEENLILKKAIAIFTLHSNNDEMTSISCASNMTSKPYAGSFTSTAVPIISTLMRLLLQESRRISTFVVSFFISMPTTTTASVLIK